MRKRRGAVSACLAAANEAASHVAGKLLGSALGVRRERSGGAAKVGAFLYHHGTRLAVVAAARHVLYICPSAKDNIL
jgi:hypothetical protein